MLLVWIFLLLKVCLSSEAKDGYCVMLGNCGKKSIFGGELPCNNYTRAIEPDDQSKLMLKEICGTETDWDKVCCTSDQIANLKTNLKRVEPLISSCPACIRNFYDFFCEFTCSPNQASFLNVTRTDHSLDGREVIAELTQYVNSSFADRFFNSCKDIKFSATNDYAMQLIGGGAKDYKQFLKFLGDEKPLIGGSPFQINSAFKVPVDSKYKVRGINAKDCNDPEYACACSDCALSCPKLKKTHKLDRKCYMGIFPCFSFIVAIAWTAAIILLGLYHIFLMRMNKDQFEHLNQIINNNTDECLDEDVTRDPLIYCATGDEFLPLHKRYEIIFNNFLKDSFAAVGYFCAGNKTLCLTLSIAISGLALNGISSFKLEKNPINLWVSPNEPAMAQLNSFQNNFGEWYRIEQFIISSSDDASVLNWETIKWWFEKEGELSALKSSEGSTLDKFCFKPLGDTCAIESFAQYFDGDINRLSNSTWQSKLADCADSPVNCLPSFQQPMRKNLLFDSDDVINSKAFVVTLLVNNNSSDLDYTEDVISFERKIKEWVLGIKEQKPELNIAFSTEISLHDELERSSHMDIKVILVSYVLMFLYSSLALGGRMPTELNMKFLLKTRFLLGLGGIIVIILSVLTSVGICAFMGLSSTLIIAEVIPFLILAIGIDNIFLIVHELHLVNEETVDLDIPSRVSLALGRIGPSCFISTVLQIAMFLLASSVPMPAVRNFAIYSAMAVAANFLLQMTMFVSLLSLDQARLESNRADVFPWIKIGDTIALDLDSSSDNISKEYDVSDFILSKVSPVLFKKQNVRKIITGYFVWVGICLSLLPSINLGLDQRQAVPHDSHLVHYFDSVSQYLNVGPPIFFVMDNVNYTNLSEQKKLCGRFSGCDKYSIANILEQEFKRKNVSTIADPASNWLDDFLMWLNPNLDQCCRVKKQSILEQKQFCSPHAPSRLCETCYANHDPPYDGSMEGFPQGDEFMDYFNHWIEQPSDPCPLGGKAPYSGSISRSEDNSKIISSYFRTSHTSLRTQDDYIVAYKNALRIVKEIKSYVKDVEIYAFSPFYVYFVQYINIYSMTFRLLGMGLAIVWILGLTLFCSIKVVTVFVFTIAMILLSMGAVFSVWSISLNAVSLVNLVICLGLSVEFTVHLAKAFHVLQKRALIGRRRSVPTIVSERDLSASKALAKVGGSILGGITFTKLIGIGVLAFAQSKIYEIYYFRMWFSLICIAVFHALVMLPIFLSYLE